FSIELLGAAAMAPVFCRDFGLLKGLWFSLFHSISAFCNAGFDLLGETAKFSSLTSYAENPVINIVIMLLILFGGLGFLTWDDIRTHHIHIRKYRMQSKVVLVMTLVLVIAPALLFFFTEFENEPFGNRILYSLFQAVTPRTAGFNTVNFSLMSEASIMVMTVLMLIGGSSGSTAGGMKTTTTAVLLSSALSVFRRKNSVSLFKRRIDDSTVKSAAAIFVMYVTLFLGGSIAISLIEDLPILTCMFEAGSAVATVGLTMGVTPSLSLASHIILMVLMYLGRVGGLTLIYATFSGTRQNLSQLPHEKITVG
ncbi:MAG: potassium transporter TrkG, partial [Oscillospiraceae bacterium]|nr:potassium transporter TrkG [Oscillospiraceae bacterium]